MSEEGGGGEGGEDEQKRIVTDEIVAYRVYEERWLGLAGLMLMKIVTSWGVGLPWLRHVLGFGEMGLLIGDYSGSRMPLLVIVGRSGLDLTRRAL